MSVTSLEALSGDSRAQRLRYRHRDYYLAIADESVDGLRGPEQQKWRRIIKDEYDNFVHAFEWSVETQDAESGLRLAMVIARTLTHRGDTDSAERFLRAALQVPGNATPARVRTMLALAENRSWPDPAEAVELRVNAHEMASTLDDKALIVDALTALGGWVSSGTPKKRADRRRALEQAMEIGKEIGYGRGIAEVAWRLAEIYRADGLTKDARDLERSALEFYRKIGDIENVGWMLYQEAWSEPDPSRSMQLAQEALDLAYRLSDLVLTSCCFELLMFISRDAVGDLALARNTLHDWRRELAARDADVPRWHKDWNTLAIASLDAIQGRWHDAQRGLEKIQSRPAGSLWPMHEREVLTLTAKVKFELEGYESALPFLREAIEVSRRQGVFLGAYLRSAAELACSAQDHTLARELLQEALLESQSTSWEIDIRELSLRIDLRLGDLDAASSQMKAIEGLSYPHGYVGRDEPARRKIIKTRMLRALGETGDARSMISAAISHLAENDHRPLLASALEEAAGLREQLGDPQRGAIILGAAKALRTAIEYPVQQIDRFAYQELEQRLRESLSDGAYDSLIAEGHGLPLAEAVALATTDTQE